MPKNEKRRLKRFGLKMVRECSGLTQKEFADLLGMPQPTYGALEAGSRTLSRQTAEQIFLISGAHPDSLLSGHFDSPTESWSGFDYGVESWNQWQDAKRKAGALNSEENRRLLLEYTDTMIRVGHIIPNPRDKRQTKFLGDILLHGVASYCFSRMMAARDSADYFLRVLSGASDEHAAD